MKSTIKLFCAGSIFLPLGGDLIASEKHPNILIILADDLGWRDLGCTGSDLYKTPNIDRIAAQGVTFVNGYSACQVSSPSRASILTGMYPVSHGITDWIGAPYGEQWRKHNLQTMLLPSEYSMNLDTDFTTIAEVLKSRGYATFIAGKWHLGSDVTPEMQGFDVNVGAWASGSPRGGYFSPYNNPKLKDGPAGENLTERLARETGSFIEGNIKTDKPFFAYLSFYAVHSSIQTTQERWKKYRDQLVERGNLADTGFVVDRLLPVRQYQDNPVYAGLVEQLDNGVGIVMDKLKELGLDDNTIVIFTSDNGGVSSGDDYSTSCYPLRGGKGRQWEGGIRVPMLIKTPDTKKPGSKCYTPVIGIDLFPTILDYAGVKKGAVGDIDGVDIRSLITGGKIKNRELYWHYPHYGNQGGEPSSIIRDGDWKLIYYHEDSHCELYNLRMDQTEQTPLNEKYPSMVSKLKTKLDKWLTDTGARMPVKDPLYDKQKSDEHRKNIISRVLLQQEKRRKDMYMPDWQPNATWWDSKITID